jgi:hypothetical protein
VTYAVEYFPRDIPSEGDPEDLQWQKLNTVVGVDYERLADVLSLVADLELCEEKRGSYRIVEAVVNGRDIFCASCHDVACSIERHLTGEEAELLPTRICRSCGMSGRIDMRDDGQEAWLVFAPDETEAQIWQLVDALLVDMVDELREQVRSERARQRGWTMTGNVWGPPLSACTDWGAE